VAPLLREGPRFFQAKSYFTMASDSALTWPAASDSCQPWLGPSTLSLS
jgi:hypothetical protein